MLHPISALQADKKLGFLLVILFAFLTPQTAMAAEVLKAGSDNELRAACLQIGSKNGFKSKMVLDKKTLRGSFYITPYAQDASDATIVTGERCLYAKDSNALIYLADRFAKIGERRFADDFKKAKQHFDGATQYKTVGDLHSQKRRLIITKEALEAANILVSEAEIAEEGRSSNIEKLKQIRTKAQKTLKNIEKLDGILRRTWKQYESYELRSNFYVCNKESITDFASLKEKLVHKWIEPGCAKAIAAHLANKS